MKGSKTPLEHRNARLDIRHCLSTQSLFPALWKPLVSYELGYMTVRITPCYGAGL